jgi:hypothetical protein
MKVDINRVPVVKYGAKFWTLNIAKRLAAFGR